MSPPRASPPARRSWAIRAIFGIFLSALYLSGALQFIERHLTDLRFNLVRSEPSGDIVVVTIDARSLQATPVWPWPRRLHAEAIEAILAAGARRIAIDVDFSSPMTPSDDRILADAIARTGQRLFLPVFEQPSNGDMADMVTTAPLPAFLEHARIASVNITPDGDGIIRRMARYASWSGHIVPALPTAMSGIDSPQTGPFYIDFGIYADHLTTVSFIDVLNRNFDPDVFEGKSVLIGATALELGDQLAAPVAGIVPGVVLQALATESLLQGRDLRRVSPWIVLSLAIAVYLLIVRLNHGARPTGYLIAAGSVAVAFAVPIAIQRTLPLMYDTLPGLVAVAAAFEVNILRRLRDLDLRLIAQSLLLSRTDSLMRRVVEATHDGIIVVDGNGRIRSVNPATEHILGKTQEQLIGEDFSRAVDNAAPMPLDGMDINAFDREAPTELQLPLPGGGLRIVEVTFRSVPGEARGTCVAVLHDVTQIKRRENEIKAARDQAEAANRSKTQFLANMSHELRTPLNAVLGFSEIIKTEMFGPLGSERYVDYSHGIHDSARHLLGIINDILDVSSIEAGDRRLAEDVFDPAQVCKSAIDLLVTRARATGIVVDLVVEQGIGRLRADRRMVLQILVNLLSNAIKFSLPKGRVTIEVARSPENGITFRVSDSGIGISEADLKRVIMPFEQVEGAHVRKHEGVGLGLPLVTSMAELHGARFQLESELGKGTTATITFPPDRHESTTPVQQVEGSSPACAEPDGSAARSASAR
jgi:PAS domain S-box-containing protein